MRIVAVSIFVLLATTAHAGLFGPSTYEECILENMKNAQSDRAALMIAAACRKQFPNKNIFDQFDEKTKPVTIRPTEKDDAEKKPKKTGLFDDLYEK
jgi:nitrogen fixation protein FixH